MAVNKNPISRFRDSVFSENNLRSSYLLGPPSKQQLLAEARAPKNSLQPQSSTTPLRRTKHLMNCTCVPIYTEIVPLCKRLSPTKLLLFRKWSGQKHCGCRGPNSSSFYLKLNALHNVQWDASFEALISRILLKKRIKSYKNWRLETVGIELSNVGYQSTSN